MLRKLLHRSENAMWLLWICRQSIPVATFDRKYEGIAKYPAVSQRYQYGCSETCSGRSDREGFDSAAARFWSYSLFDIYEGAQIKAGFKSLAYTLTFRAKDQTLEEAEITAAMKKILNGLERLVLN